MQYMLLIYGDERATESASREQTNEIINAYMAYGQALSDAKVVVGSNRLRPTSVATTVRIAEGGPGCSTGRSPRPRTTMPDLGAAPPGTRCPGARYGTVQVRRSACDPAPFETPPLAGSGEDFVRVISS
jgi:hypothetical protein